MKVSQLIS